MRAGFVNRRLGAQLAQPAPVRVQSRKCDDNACTVYISIQRRISHASPSAAMMTPTPSRSTEIAGEPSGNLENGFQLGPFGVIDFHPIDGESASAAQPIKNQTAWQT